MTKTWASVLALIVFSATAAAQTIVDGDTLKQFGVTYRLFGIDAPESKQACPDGWPAGHMATTRMLALTAGRAIVCQEKDRDRYGRLVAICRVGGQDLGAILVREGLAWAFVRYSSVYVEEEATAKRDRLGIHAHGCQPAWEWRALQRGMKQFRSVACSIVLHCRPQVGVDCSEVCEFRLYDSPHTNCYSSHRDGGIASRGHREVCCWQTCRWY